METDRKDQAMNNYPDIAPIIDAQKGKVIRLPEGSFSVSKTIVLDGRVL